MVPGAISYTVVLTLLRGIKLFGPLEVYHL